MAQAQFTRTEQKRLDTALYVSLTDDGVLVVRCRTHLADEDSAVIARARRVLELGVSIHSCEVCHPAPQPHAASHR